MKVRLEDIPPEGLTVEFTDARVRPQDLGPQVGAVRQPPWARLQVKLLGEMLQAKGEYTAELDLVCSRCLQPSPLTIRGELDLVFKPAKPEQTEEVQLDEDELEFSFYQAGEVDLAQALRDELSLALPMAPLCREQCPGLCPVCGRLQSEGPCGCRKKETDPRWAKLAKLDLNK